jgi:hypothetical protein
LLPFTSPLVLSPFVTNNVLAVGKAMKEEKTRSMQTNKLFIREGACAMAFKSRAQAEKW